MKILLKNKGLYTTISPEDYSLISPYTWIAHTNSSGMTYAATTITENGKRKFVYMHRLITNCPQGKIIDHWDGNTLNNERWNLRICTRAENNRNVRKTKKRSLFHSQYKGVYWRKDRNIWEASIRFNKKQIHLGFFDDELTAALMYDKYAREYFGDYASCNFPIEGGKVWNIDLRNSSNTFSQKQNGSLQVEAIS